MTPHELAQKEARDKKAQRKAHLAELEKQQRFYAEKRARMVYLTIDHDDMLKMLLSEELVPENTERVEFVQNGKDGWQVIAHKS